MKIDTIVTDLDDTLLNEDTALSPETLRVMAECKKRGIRLIPASGRAQPSMEGHVRQLNTGLPYVACNGAQLVNSDHSLMEEFCMPAALALEVHDFMDREDCYVQVYHGDKFYYAKECKPSREYKKSSGMAGEAVGDLRAFLTFDTPKLLAVAAPEIIARAYAKSKELFAGRVAFSISKPYFLEAVPIGIDKGTGLRRLSSRMDIRPENTLVFGDSLNDLSMLAFGPNSVAMGNAREEVKQAAAYVCRSNAEDGVAHFVREHVLEGSPS